MTKEILLLGSGFVAKPAVDYLLKRDDFHITCISLFQNELDGISKGYTKEKISTVQLDVVNKVDELNEFIPKSDVVISLLPATLHPIVAKLCIKYKKHFITASYISPEMKSLDKEAKEAGITFLNELGLDPGIDHMSSMKIIDHAKANGGQVVSFVSWCGALPSMDNNDNPFGYKFSWSPKGVLLSASLSAKFLWDGHTDEVPANIKFAVLQPVNIQHQDKLLEFEGVANRDSFPYIESYNLNPQHVKTMYRGTLRWKGFGVMVRALAAIGLFSTNPDERLIVSATSSTPISWRKYLIQLLGCNDNDGDLVYCLESQIKEAFQQQKTQSEKEQFNFPIINRDIEQDTKYAIEGFKWLGMFSNDEIIQNRGNIPLDTLCATLEKKLSYQPDQVDIVVLQHEFIVKYSDHMEKETSKLICFGQKGGSSGTSITVGVPVGIAAELILDQVIKEHGVIGPVTPEIYLPILDKLKKEGIEMIETLEKI
ncbi:hypothetical protein DLAC_11537 [Tieghemostelium lacteum]|uniref:Saccharopine dehydrogenase n=1 Tax=Tieghemostelium lacteum TaxID=361077 RepID=A0A152A2F3_TIELA|nr:hypothetical protein DLAC_11537 [Tieghemostelium lacteum]|eukprot:KYR00432.1 hypothetical protein DLAC_11537 [Tieghemostelium lacteum]